MKFYVDKELIKRRPIDNSVVKAEQDELFRDICIKKEHHWRIIDDPVLFYLGEKLIDL